jgi:phage protein U
MLMQLGSVAFEVYPLNAHEHTRSAEMGFVEKAVLGARPPLEKVGEGAETRTISGRVFPRKFGGLGQLASLEAARAAGQPLFLMRGDGAPLGFFVIERLSETNTYLAANGVGQVIEFDVMLKAAGRPSPSNYVVSITGMLGGL